MTTALSIPRPPFRDASPAEYVWTPDAYHAAADAGLFADARVELLAGKVYVMPPMRDRHKLALNRALQTLIRHFGDGFTVQCQVPLRLGAGEPEPDLSVVRGGVEKTIDPDAEVVLVVEIADTSLAFDRAVKLAVYARAGIAEYWIVDLSAGRVEVRRDPSRQGRVYATVTSAGVGDTLAPLASGKTVAVKDLLP